jgi:hypothetical protein
MAHHVDKFPRCMHALTAVIMQFLKEVTFLGKNSPSGVALCTHAPASAAMLARA